MSCPNFPWTASRSSKSANTAEPQCHRNISAVIRKINKIFFLIHRNDGNCREADRREPILKCGFDVSSFVLVRTDPDVGKFTGVTETGWPWKTAAPMSSVLGLKDNSRLFHEKFQQIKQLADLGVALISAGLKYTSQKNLIISFSNWAKEVDLRYYSL